MAQPPKYAVFDAEIPEETKAGFSPALRCFVNPKGPIPTETKDGSKTTWEIFEKSVGRNKGKDFLGSRTLLKRDMVPSSDGKKKFEKVELSDTYKFQTYAEVFQSVEHLAGALTSELGLQAKDGILLFADTQASWMVTAFACWRQNVKVITAYSTLGPDGVKSALNQTKSSVIVCDAKLVSIVAAVKNDCPSLKHVVVIPTKVDPTVEDLQKSVGEGLKVVSVDQLISAGKSTPVAPNACDPADTAVIMYTSGTTGNAKGVVISHRALVATCRSTVDFISYIDSTTVFLAYLPLAHIMEMSVELTACTVGACIGYGSAQTLTDTGVRLAKGQKGDAPVLKPTAMVFAPAVLDRVYNGVMDKIRGSGCKETVFNSALANGYANYDAGGVGASCCFNKIFQSSVQSLVGGRVKNILAGSAPLSAEIQKFAQTCFNAPARQGYGLTETCAASCVAHQSDNTLSQVGGPTPGTILRLRDWPEGNYQNSDKDKEGVKMRRGEVLLGGPMIADGYWIDESNPDPEIQAKNAEDWVEVGGIRYFCSGDVGQILPKGQLMIIDRKKDLFKGAAGEYVSLSKVEALAKLSPYIEIPMAYGKTGSKGIIMVCVPKKGAIDKFASEQKLTMTKTNYPEVAAKKAFVDMIHKSVVDECKKGGLKAFELPLAAALCVAPDGSPAWTPENDLLTTTMKLKRPTIAQTYSSQIDAAYAGL